MIRDATGKAVQMVDENLKITDRKQAEEALRFSEQRAKAFLENSAIIAWLKDEEGRNVFLSDNYVRRFRLENWQNKTDFELWPHDIAEQYRQNDLAVLGCDGPLECVEEARTPSGDLSYWLNSKFWFQDEAGRKYVGGVGVDITERKQAEILLKEQAELLDLAHDAIIVRSTEGVITYWNHGAENMYGWTKEAALNNVTHVLFRTQFPVPLKEIELELHKRGWWEGTLTQRRQNGTRVIVTSRWTLHRSPGKPNVVLEINNDITDRIEAERERELRAAELAVMLGKRTDEMKRAEKAERLLRDADRRKDEFLATLAHELRNPLAPLRSALQIIRHSNEREDWEMARDVMERQVSQIVRLVDDLLDVSRITQGKLELRKEHLDLRDVLNSVLQSARPAIDAATHELTVNLPPQPIPVQADSMRLAQVFQNLLNNAAKFTKKAGHIWLTAEQHSNKAIVSVRDNGIGIPAEHLSHIFTMFSQLAPALERSEEGLGIGLSLAKGLIELHGGTIEARSDGPGQGSEFTIHLPVVRAPFEVSQRPTGDGEPVNRARQCRILVVDDRRDTADSMAMMLSIFGHETRTAYDGAEALQTAATFRPAVVLLDIGLPNMHGYETARRFREQPWGANVALIALTGFGQEKDKTRSSEAGFDHHLTKPVSAADLQRLLAFLVPQE